MADRSDNPDIVVTGVEQREAWRDRTAPPVEHLGEELWSVPVPMPNNPLRYVLVYAFATSHGLMTIDAGWESDEAWAAYTAGLATFGAGPADVRGVLVTHMHYDHVGLAARIREASDAWIGMHRADVAILADPAFQHPVRARETEGAHLRSIGGSEEQVQAALGTAERWSTLRMPAVPDRLIEDGQLIDVGDRRLRAVHTPGHTPGHLAFFDDERGTLFSGDHVLPRITPNISLATYSEDDPLGSFLSSLTAVAGLPARHVNPAHEWRFDGLSARVAQLHAHHHARCDEVIAALLRHPDSTPWQVAAELTWSRPWADYDGRMQIFAVTETAAHVRHLDRLGLVLRTDGEQPTYRVAPGVTAMPH